MITANGPKPCDASISWPEAVRNVRQEAVREERRRFANELHDVVANHLNAATLFLASARQSLPSGEIRDLIDQATASVRECWSDARRSAKGLRPAGLAARELTAVLSEYARHLSIASGVNVTFASSGSPLPLSADAKFAFLRVTQEAAANAIRHARPSSVCIELQFAADGIRLTVSDDGPGFDTAHVPDGMGVSTMRDRARQIGAELVIRSDPSRGTQVALTLAGRDGQRRDAGAAAEVQGSPQGSPAPLFPVMLFFAGRCPSTTESQECQGADPQVDAASLPG